MSRGLQKLVWIVLLAGVLLVQGSFYDNMNDTDENDYSSDDDDHLKDRINLAEEKELKEPKTKILTKPQIINIREGGTAFLPCDIQFAESYTIIWKNGTSATLFLDFAKISEDRRIWKFLNNTIVIRNASIYDGGSYRCEVVTPKVMYVTHRLVVYRPLTIINTVPEVKKDKPFVLIKGEPLTLTCNATGYPAPQIIWTRYGRHKHFPNGHQVMEGETIKFDRVTRTYSGIYVCIARNAVQSLQVDIKILVQHPPEIEIEQETITSQVGHAPQLFCSVYAEPPATVEWYKNNKHIDDKMSYTFSKKQHNYFLQINKVTEGDFGNYKCVATNFLGVEEKTIILTGSPTKPIFKGGHSTDKNMVEIRWYVESYTPVIEYEFQYRKELEDEWTKLTPIIIQSVQENIYTAKVILLGLPPDNYKIRVRARNANGWSLFSDEKEFSGDTPSRGGPPVIKPIVTVLPFIVAVCVCYM